jgi:uncharacterized protein (TIGR02466 family)
MNEEILEPFVSPIIIKQYDDDLAEKLYDICLKENPNEEEWEDYEVLDWDYPAIKELESRFVDVTRDYIGKYVEVKTEGISLTTWCNIRKNGSYHPAHTHPNVDLILNYYVNTPKNSEIIIFNPAPAMASNNWASKQINLQVKQNMLLIMPPWFLHEVPPTLVDEYRISISCNVKFN